MTDSPSPPIAALRGPVPLCHLFLHTFIHAGHHVIDTTCGNGHDTLLLAQLVGNSGHVWGFDIQPQALAGTGRKLSEAGVADRVTLLQAGHEELNRHVTSPVQTVLFNLGYLPGSDRNIITRPETTGAALRQAAELLTAGGVIIVTVYPGHDGGAEEQAGVEQWASRLDPKSFHSWRMMQTNVSPTAPYLLLVQKAL